MSELDVIIPNLHWNYTGVTATNRMIAPRIARLVTARWLGRDAPEGIEIMSFGDLMTLRFGQRRPLVWHARRNNEMMIGLVLRSLGWPLKMIFTSAAQRHHTWITRWLISRMDAVIAASDAAASYLKVPATVILHGVDTERYHPPKNRDAEFAISGLARAIRGRLLRARAPSEGHRRFRRGGVRTVAEISGLQRGHHRSGRRSRSFEASLKARVAEAGLTDRVRFLGELPIDDVPLWYRRILIYAFTSRNEGFGLTLLEAMASGNALVAARAGAAEAVVTGGKVALLVTAGDAGALAAALEPLMRDPELAAAMGMRAREYVAAHFSIQSEAEQIVAVYRQVNLALS